MYSLNEKVESKPLSNKPTPHRAMNNGLVRYGLIIMASAALMITQACSDSTKDGDGNGNGGGANGPAPVVTEITPEDQTEGHSRDVNVTVTFDLEMNPSTVNVQSISGPCEGAIQISSDAFVTCRGGTVDSSQNPLFTVDLAGFLSEDTIYKVRVTTQANSTEGTAMEANHNQQLGFGVGDVTFGPIGPPEVSSVFPNASSGPVDLDTAIQIEFNKEMDLDSFDPSNAACNGNVHLSNDNFVTCVPLSLDVITSETENPVIVFLVDEKLEQGASYRISIEPSVLSSDGVALEEEYLSGLFTTCGVLSNGTTCNVELDSTITWISGRDYDLSDIFNADANNFDDARFLNICASTITTDGKLFAYDSGSQSSIRMVDIPDTSVDTVAGPEPQTYTTGDNPSGTGTVAGSVALFDLNPAGYGGMTQDYNNGKIYFADANNHKVREYDIDSGNVRTLAGAGTSGFTDNVSGTAAEFAFPSGMTYARYEGNDYLFVIDVLNERIRRIDLSDASVTTVAGDGTACTPSIEACDGIGAAANFRFNGASSRRNFGMAFDGERYIYFTDGATNPYHSLRRLDLTNYEVETLKVGDADFGTGSLPVKVTIAGDALYLGFADVSKVLRYGITNNTLSSAVGNGTTRTTYSGSPPQAPPDASVNSSCVAAPQCVIVSPDGLFISESGGRVLRHVPAL